MISGNFYSRFFHFFLLALAIAICYSGTLESSWHFDDIYNITKNKNIQVTSLGWSEICNASFNSPNTAKLSRPVAFFTFALNYYFSGFDTTGYHLVNITIHILCAIFAYLVFVRTLELYPGASKFNSTFSIPDIALLGAMLWALHPMQTQAVTYIVQRMASMAALLYMIAMYCYLCFRTGDGRNRWTYLVLAGIFWVTGIFTKENAALLPLSLIAYEFAFFGFSLKLHKRYVLLLAGTFAIIGTVAFYVMYGDFQKMLVETYSIRSFSMWERLLTEPIVLCRYLLLILLPIADYLTVESDIFVSTGFFSPPATMPAILLISSLVILSICYVRKFPLICFAGLFYFINHLVESTFFSLELYFEHRNYLPSIFIYLVVSYYFCIFVKHYLEKRKALLYGLLVLLMTVIVLSEGNATYLRNDVWESEITLLSDAIEKAPNNIRPYISLGVEFMKLKQVDKAKEMYRKAEKLYKLSPRKHQYNFVALLYYNAGISALRNKDNTKAIQLMLKSSEIDPGSFETHVNLGYLFFVNGDLKNAETAYKNALQLRPKEPSIYNFLGRTLYAKDEIDSAVEVWKRGLEVEGMPEMELNLVGGYIRKGDLRSARVTLLRMPYRERDLAYLLYRTALFQEDREGLFNKVADDLVGKNIDYCSWASTIVKNDFAGLIYPEKFNEVEGELRAIYLEKLNSVKENIDATKNIINKCDIANQVSIGNNSLD